MKRFTYIIMIIYYLIAWISLDYIILPKEFNIGLGFCFIKVLGEIGINAVIENAIIFGTLIVFTSLSHFKKRSFNLITILVLAGLLFFNLFSIVMAYGIPLLINIVLFPMTIYIGKTEITPEQIENEKAENNLHKFITEDLSKEA